MTEKPDVMVLAYVMVGEEADVVVNQEADIVVDDVAAWRWIRWPTW